MSWVKSLWDKIVDKTSTAPEFTVVEVEEVEERSAGSIFGTLCRAAGVKQKDLISLNAEALFDEWYVGKIDEEEIKQSVEEFKALHPGINAKLAGRL